MIRKRGTDSRPSKKGGRSRATSREDAGKRRRRAPQGSAPRGTRSREERLREEREAPERQVAGRKRRPVGERGKQPRNPRDPRQARDPRNPRDLRQQGQKRQQGKPRQPQKTAAQLRAQRARRRWLLKRISFVLVIICAVLAVLWLVSFSLKKIEEHTTPPDPARAFDPIPCQVEFLNASIDKTSGTAGQPVVINVKLKNVHGSAPCVFGTSSSDFSVKVTSGDYTAYDSAACEEGVEAPRLLLDKGVESTQTFTWDGKNSGPKCTGGGAAQPGTYKAQVFYLGEPLTEDGRTFIITAPPAPAP